MAERVRVRELSDQEGSRLLRIVRRDSGSVVTWRRAQLVLLAAQGMPALRLAEVTFTSEDRPIREALSDRSASTVDAEGKRSLSPPPADGHRPAHHAV